MEAVYLDGDDVAGAVDHRQALVHEQLPHVFDVPLVGSSQGLSLLALQDPDGLQCPGQDHWRQGGGEDEASCERAHCVHQGGAAGNITSHAAECFALRGQTMAVCKELFLLEHPDVLWQQSLKGVDPSCSSATTWSICCILI